MTDTLAPEDAQVKALIEQETLLRELTSTAGWAELVRVASISIDAFQDRLNTGKLSVDDYRFTAGFLDGARQLLAIPELISEKLRRTERDLADEDAEDYPPFNPSE